MVKQIYKKSFCGDTAKEAYLKAVRWYAETVLKSDYVNDGLVHMITRDRKKNFPTYDLTIFLIWDLRQEREEYCKRCRELSQSFLGDGPVDCVHCKLSAFERQVEAKLAIVEKVKRVGIENNEKEKQKKDRTH